MIHLKGENMARPSMSLLARAAALLAGSILAVANTGTASAWYGSVDWLQWGQNAQHQGSVDVPAQSLEKVLAQTNYDPFTAAEKVDGGGSLLVHYQTPLRSEERRVGKESRAPRSLDE